MQEVLGETYELQTAVDGKTALELVASTCFPDLILLDVKMPGVDGYEVCRRLKADEKTRDIPIIFLTSLAADEDQTKGLELGAVDFIIKPSEFALIKRRIQIHLELKQHRDQLQNLVAEKMQELDSVKKSEQEKEALLQKILKSVPVAVGFVVDRKIVWANQRTAEMTGYSCAELEGQSARMMYATDTGYNEVVNEYPEIQKTGFSAFETVLRTKSGADIDVHVNAAALDKENLSAGVIFAVSDITECKQSEKTLQISENRLKQAQHVAQIGNWQLDIESGSLYWSDEIYLIFELVPQQFGATYEAFLDVIHPDDREFVNEAYLESVKNRTQYSIEHRLLLKSGKIKYVHERGETRYDANGNPITSLGTVQDITARRLIENKVIQAKEEWEATFDAMSDMVTIHDRDMRIVRANKAAHEFFGADYGQLNGKMCCEVFWGPADNCPDCPLLRTYSDLKTHSEILSYNIPGKSLLVTTTPISSETGPPEYFIHIAKDITEQVQLEEEASRANRLAALGELAAGVAHEINNPNALILYNSEILEAVMKDVLPTFGEYQPDASGQLFGGLSYQEAIQEIPVLLPAIHDSAQRIKRIVNDLRDFARQDGSDVDESVNLNQVVKAATRLVNNAIKKATDHFKLNLAETLPGVTGVKGRLEQVVINLLLNACQALDNRSQKISLTTVYVADIDQLQVIVADEGQGMSAEVAAHILEPFVTTKRDQGGTGLGLSVSARIVKEHHGELKFTSSPGQGTTVTLSLPVRKEANHVS